MVDASQVVAWCTAAGHAVSARPGEPVLALELGGSGGRPARVELGSGDEPLRFAATVPAAGTGLETDLLDGVLAVVAIARPALVDVRRDPAGAAEASVTLYPDGVTRHSVLAALDELVKTRYAIEEALESARQAQALRAALAGAAREPNPVGEPDVAGEPASDEEAAAPTEVAAVASGPSGEPMAATGWASAPAAPASTTPEPPAPRWCYVEGAVPVQGLDGSGRVDGHLQPGRWYQWVAEEGGWARVADPEGTLEGWADPAQLRFQRA